MWVLDCSCISVLAVCNSSVIAFTCVFGAAIFEVAVIDVACFLGVSSEFGVAIFEVAAVVAACFLDVDLSGFFQLWVCLDLLHFAASLQSCPCFTSVVQIRLLTASSV